MNYLKFAGLCLLAGAVFFACGVYVSTDYLGLALALAITGAGFALVHPRHLKFGYTIWIAAVYMLVLGLRLLNEHWVDGSVVRGRLYTLGLVVFIALHPICYWLGKRLAKVLGATEETSSLAEHFD